MHILVTNDDGIDSPGLWALAGLYAAGRLPGDFGRSSAAASFVPGLRRTRHPDAGQSCRSRGSGGKQDTIADRVAFAVGGFASRVYLHFGTTDISRIRRRVAQYNPAHPENTPSPSRLRAGHSRD